MKGSLWKLASFALPLKGRIGLAILLGCITVGSGIGLLATSAYLISAAALHPSIAVLEIAIVGVRFFGITRGICRYLERYVSHHIAFQLLAKLRVWFFQALEPLAPARLMQLKNDQNNVYASGDLLSRVVADVEILQNFYVRVIAPIVVAGCVAIAMWFFLSSFHVSFAIILLTFYLLVGVGLPLVTYCLSRRSGQRSVVTQGKLHQYIVDGLQGMADVVAFGRERSQLARIEQMNEELADSQTRLAWIGGMQGAVGQLCVNLTTWTILLVAIPFIRHGELDGMYLALLCLATMASFEAVLPLSATAQSLGSTVAASRRLTEIIHAQPTILDGVRASPTPLHYGLEVQNLSFCYDKNEPYVVDNVSLNIPQGHCVALVGPSGSGKSTVANLLLRFWEYEEGQIMLGSYNLHMYHQDDIRRLVSVVSQDTHLFNTTIRANILLAKPQANQDELEWAARQAQLHDFVVALPHGYDTLIGEQGLCLSGGERQRIALARAFLKQAPILILDEATSHLDPLTERALLQTMRTFIQQHTTLLITHHLIGLEMADEILVMDKGRIRERGAHHELMQLEGLFWRMSRLQSQGLT